MAAKKKAKKKAAKKRATKKTTTENSGTVAVTNPEPVTGGTGTTTPPTPPVSGALGGTVGLDQSQDATEVEQPGESPVIEEEDEDFTSGSDLEEDFEDED